MLKALTIFLLSSGIVLSTDEGPSKHSVSRVVTVTTPSSETMNDVLIKFFNANVSPVVDMAVKRTTSDVDMSITRLTNHVTSLFTSILGVLEEIRANKAVASPALGAGKKDGNKTSADPFPGYLEDYQFLMGIVTGAVRCGECCTCLKGEMCLFHVYVQLFLIVNNNPSWQPPNLLTAVSFSGISTNKNSVALELVLQNLGKKRCMTCMLCKEISRDQKLSFMFNTDVISKLFGSGDSADKQMLLNLITGGAVGPKGFEHQLNLLPILLSFVEKGKRGKSAAPTCPFMGQSSRDTCHASVPASTTCPSQLPPVRPGVPNATAPPACNVPTSSTTPVGAQPAYGIPFSPSGVPVHQINPSAQSGSKPAYGVGYGTYV
ncbi:hypothetical protein VCUG_01824 [Vavraia culicis subsp. floridensis]|uniref:Uncharacterized protein n=1 Tax=Vavraia culicis (isolate floridensis) TaxID=948595 RepID=L2GSQ9_VAVCU|nr:uncharacterized protein VCUG_01824 [Vavraia culicis subsp. floridensis]ELA46674.1 hypothetical protein VCUG_01824 [Vavraia culicis subsp. floridensis]